MTQSSNTSSVRTPEPARVWWKQPRLWVIWVVAAFAAWLLLTIALTAYHGYRTFTATKSAAKALTSGDAQGAQQYIATAQSNAHSLQSSLDGLPLSLLRVIPYVNTNLSAVEGMVTAGADMLDAANVVTQATGDEPLLQGSRINLTAVESLTPHVGDVAAQVTEAQAALSSVPDDASPRLREFTASGREQLDTLQRGLHLYELIGPDMPRLLGAERPQTYLVVFQNPAELYAGGGASLNVALVRFDDGQVKGMAKGPVSTRFFPGNPSVPWDPVAKGPYFATKNATDGFAWSNLHQDFRVAGEDMLRSWEANGGRPVDGVISLDPAALAAAVRATGPIQTPLYGEITADNMIQKLFFEGYNEDAAAQAKRHEINQQLIQEMLRRMQDSGTQAAAISAALFNTAADQHLRVYLSGARESQALHEMSLDGAQPDPQPDRIAFYTQNQNSSKVDIFQTRQLVHDVTLAADGSAQITQTATVTNNAPKEGGSPLTDRIGYTTRWAFHWNIALMPADAKDITIEANAGDIKRDPKVYTDVDGRKAVRIGRWIPPGESSIITVTYRLPPGTFGSAGNLEYRASVEHQLLVNDVDLTVNVTGPSEPTPQEGNWIVDQNTATTHFAVTRPSTIAVSFGGRG